MVLLASDDRKTVVSRTRSGSVMVRLSGARSISGNLASCSGVSSFSSRSHQTRLLSSYSASSILKPISVAKRRAPSPVSITWGRRFITSWARAETGMVSGTAPTVPTSRVVPSITPASNSIRPSILGQPPKPTERTRTSRSTKPMPATMRVEPRRTVLEHGDGGVEARIGLGIGEQQH